MSYFSYNISVSGMQAAQKMLAVTNNNIANVETPSYARQSLQVAEGEYTQTNGIDAEMGSGVRMMEVSRIADEFLIQRAREENAKKSYFGSAQSALSDVEGVFNETQEGSMSSLMAQFFDSWSEASKYPEDAAYRQSVLGVGKTLSDRFNAAGRQIDVAKSQTDEKIANRIDKINDLLAKIADLNKKMPSLASENPNQIFDQRDKYLDELSAYTNIEVTPTSQKMVDVRVGGVLLVSKDNFNKVSGLVDTASQTWSLTANGVLLKPQSGELKAQLDVRNTYLPQYEAKANAVIGTLISQVNAAHAAGFGLDNSTGNSFFQGTTMYDVQLNPLLAANPQKVALSAISGTPGNAKIGSQIAGIKDALVMNGGTETVGGFYRGFATQVGTDLNTMKDSQHVHSQVFEQVTASRQNVQGASIDEEMANLMKFQRFYEANARSFKTMNDMFDQLTHLLG